ncbi:13826_t:CDS:2 [Funneliformis geosporum]|uniref:15456_t:CDS:1 n=1 Tax=Funneliformis geosporum TaxID=1117311 RepID=A0A9W4SBI3_9GLOM|nr:15456_t:CDS:2 [Funneliformis geosporum]CAI2178283.1 13826_t:CDS:2 [Funneliformis geosporum]
MSSLSRFTTAWKHIRFPWRSIVYVGSDNIGNEYFESTKKINGRTKRMVELKVKKELVDYSGDEIPVQWGSWLRHTRYDPPTIEEIVLANKRRELIIERAKKLDQEYEEQKAKLASDQSKDQQKVPSEVEGDKKSAAHKSPPKIPVDSFEPEPWNPISKKK